MKRLDLPPVWMIGTGAMMALLAALAPSPGFRMPLAGGVLMIAALLIMGWTALWFYRKRTTIIPHETPTALVTEGPMRLSRNPIYAADALLLLGLGLWLGALLPLLLVPGFIWVIERRFIRGEEERLRHAFGPAFDAYAARVRRWI